MDAQWLSTLEDKMLKAESALVEEFKKRRELGEAIIADKAEDNFVSF